MILEDVPDVLKLEDIEQQLLATDLIFIKVKKLPGRTQMKAMVDKVINVPLEDHDITKTIETLPRHPDDAHLIGVQLKRKVEMKNSHLVGYIRPGIVIQALKTLKARGNKYYQNVQINENFMDKD